MGKVNGVPLDVEISKTQMDELKIFARISKRPFPIMVKRFLRLGMYEWYRERCNERRLEQAVDAMNEKKRRSVSNGT